MGETQGGRSAARQLGPRARPSWQSSGMPRAGHGDVLLCPPLWLKALSVRLLAPGAGPVWERGICCGTCCCTFASVPTEQLTTPRARWLPPTRRCSLAL
eukprot:scaffold2970_cov355-Prasinococcus_capsulatus_cf.AAC.2